MLDVVQLAQDFQ